MSFNSRFTPYEKNSPIPSESLGLRPFATCCRKPSNPWIPVLPRMHVFQQLFGKHHRIRLLKASQKRLWSLTATFDWVCHRSSRYIKAKLVPQHQGKHHRIHQAFLPNSFWSFATVWGFHKSFFFIEVQILRKQGEFGFGVRVVSIALVERLF